MIVLTNTLKNLQIFSHRTQVFLETFVTYLDIKFSTQIIIDSI